MSTELTLSIEGLVKRYRHIVAVDGLDLAVKPGELVGFIGPNGAGKTTTMRCIAGQLNPDAGKLTVGGISVPDDPVEARAQIGYVPQELALYQYLTGREFLHFVADIRGVPSDDQEARVAEMLALGELEKAADRIIREYSGGMARKMAIASALIARPPLLLLDESFVGLDPESTFALRKHLERYCEDGGTILLSSHVLDMLERLCTRVVIIAAGRVQADYDRQEVDAAVAGGSTLTDLYMEATGRD